MLREEGCGADLVESGFKGSALIAPPAPADLSRFRRSIIKALGRVQSTAR